MTASAGRPEEQADDGQNREDPLDEVRAELDRLDDIPVEEHPEVFARINALLAEELAALDDV